MSEKPEAVAIPLEAILMLVAELKSDESVAASFLKHHVDEAGDSQTWSKTPIPELCDYYTGSRQLVKIIMTLLTMPPPENVPKSATEGKLVIDKREYLTLMTLVDGLKDIKSSLKWTYNISLEVH